jgi:uncharacterized protein (DUF433 family)
MPSSKSYDRVSIDPGVCGGKPCVRGTRIWVSLVLDMLASSGMKELQREFPQLADADVRACVAFGAKVVREKYSDARPASAAKRAASGKPIDSVLESMRSHPAVKVHRGASKEEIRAALRILKRKLPESYTKFLLMHGWANINGDVLLGLGPDVTDAESMYESAMFESVRATPPMDSELIPLMADGAGNHECLDTGRISGGDAPVVLWQHDHPKGELQKPKLVAKTFTAWLAKKIKEAPDI